MVDTSNVTDASNDMEVTDGDKSEEMNHDTGEENGDSGEINGDV